MNHRTITPEMRRTMIGDATASQAEHHRRKSRRPVNENHPVRALLVARRLDNAKRNFQTGHWQRSGAA